MYSMNSWLEMNALVYIFGLVWSAIGLVARRIGVAVMMWMSASCMGWVARYVIPCMVVRWVAIWIASDNRDGLQVVWVSAKNRGMALVRYGLRIQYPVWIQ